jgi:hypothetical protein
VQGWAVVDNTVGVDWNNVQLSLVAGAPQSFIQPLSQPLYTQRPTIPIATAAQNAPITHDAAEFDRLEMAARLKAPPPGLPPASQSVMVTGNSPMAIQTQDMPGAGMVRNGANVGVGYGNGYGPGYGGNSGGGVYRASDVMQAGDVSTNAFDDFFEYALTQPVTIHKNESAMVPILQQDLPTTHITVWSDTHPTPLRAIWLENTSKLTLDSGSFSIFESGEFAGEGLLDPIHPGEKRLLSYAVDQAVKVRRGDFSQTRTLHRVAVHEGVLVETTSSVTDTIYTVTNAGDETRAVMVEHRRQPRAELVPSEYPTDAEKPVETTATAYRFRMAVEPHKSVDLHVKEHADIDERVQIGTQFGNGQYLITIGNYSPELAEKLKPAVDAQTALSDLNSKIDEITEKQKTLADDENRYRENLKALKDSTTAKRFVDELNQAEDAIEAARKEQTDLEKQRDQAQAHLDIVIAKLSFDTDLDVVLSKTP